MTTEQLSANATSSLKKSLKHDHVFAIIRIDDFHDDGTPIEERIAVTKVLWDAEDANREVERLNELNRDKRSRYFLQITRLEKGECQPDSAETLSPLELKYRPNDRTPPVVVGIIKSSDLK